MPLKPSKIGVGLAASKTIIFVIQIFSRGKVLLKEYIFTFEHPSAFTTINNSNLILPQKYCNDSHYLLISVRVMHSQYLPFVCFNNDIVHGVYACPEYLNIFHREDDVIQYGHLHTLITLPLTSVFNISIVFGLREYLDSFNIPYTNNNITNFAEQHFAGTLQKTIVEMLTAPTIDGPKGPEKKDGPEVKKEEKDAGPTGKSDIFQAVGQFSEVDLGLTAARDIFQEVGLFPKVDLEGGATMGSDISQGVGQFSEVALKKKEEDAGSFINE